LSPSNDYFKRKKQKKMSKYINMMSSLRDLVEANPLMKRRVINQIHGIKDILKHFKFIVFINVLMKLRR
jgi:hypothetical protein